MCLLEYQGGLDAEHVHVQTHTHTHTHCLSLSLALSLYHTDINSEGQITLKEYKAWLDAERAHTQTQARTHTLSHCAGQITSREYKVGLDPEHSLDWQQFSEMFNPEVSATYLYIFADICIHMFVYIYSSY